MRVKDVMTTPVVTVTPNRTPKYVATLLVERGISAVPVVDQDGDLVGIVSEGDLVPLDAIPEPRSRMIPPKQRRIPTTVAAVMTREVLTLPESADVAEAARLMLERRLKRLPIVEGSRVVGIVSRRDLLRVLARSDAEIQTELQQVLDDERVTLGRLTGTVSAGVATLTGPMDRSNRHLAEILARNVPGVISVTFTDDG